MTKFSFACAAALGFAGAAHADVTIGFDDLTTGTVVTDQYRGLGVVFGGNWQVQGPSPFTNAVSGPNSMQVFDPANTSNNYTVVIDFVVPGTSIPAATRFFAFTPTDSSVHDTQFFMRAYNPEGFEIGFAEMLVDADGVYDPQTDPEIMFTAQAGQSIAHMEVTVAALEGARVVEGDNFRFGDIIVPPCGPADLGKIGGFVGADRMLDNNDFIAFITLFFASDSRADVGETGGLAGSDGLYDNNDFIAFITLFFEGCDE